MHLSVLRVHIAYYSQSRRIGFALAIVSLCTYPTVMVIAEITFILYKAVQIAQNSHFIVVLALGFPRAARVTVRSDHLTETSH